MNNEIEKPKKKKTSWIPKLVIAGLLAFNVWVFGPMITTGTNDLYHSVYPSEKRIEFVEKFGFPLKGYSSQVEDSPENLSKIGFALNLEQRTKDIKMSGFRIAEISRKNVGGNYNTSKDAITVEKELGIEGIHHEIKHDKVNDILKYRPDFLKEWGGLSAGNEGVVYVGKKWGDNFLDQDSLLKLGVVSNYSRLSVGEDIAEICAKAENSPRMMADKYFSNDLIKIKLDLASEVGLISEEFSEYASLNKILNDTITMNGNNGKRFKEMSSFLDKNSSSVYESRVLFDFAKKFETDYYLPRALASEGFSEKEASLVDSCISNYKKVLSSDYKDPYLYSSALESLSRNEFMKSLYEGEVNKDVLSEESFDRGIVYRDAKAEFMNRIKSGDLNLANTGVNDYLIKKGIDLK